jgi:hypothetical protein
VYYYGKCIHANKTAARFHLLDCSSFSNHEEKDIVHDVSNKNEHVIMIKHPQSPQPPTQNNNELIKKTEKDLSKTIELMKNLEKQMTDLKKDVKTQLTTLQTNVTASNTTANKTLGTMLERSLPPPPTKVKVSQTANPTLECTIANLPYKKDENLNDIIMNITKKKDLNITPNDFHAFRAIKKNDEKKRDHPPLIIIAFRNNDMKNTLKKRHENDPKPKDYDAENNQPPIFINENLTQKQRQLFYRTRLFKKKYGYSYAWTRDGEILVRKDENSRPHCITSQTELDFCIQKEEEEDGELTDNEN